MKALFNFSSLEINQDKNLIEVNNPPEICCETLAEIIAAVEPLNVIAFNTKGKFSLYNIVDNIVEKLGGKSEISFTTFGLSEPAIRKLANMKFKGQLTALNCVLDYRIQQRQPKAFKLISSIANRIGYNESHAKITVIENNKFNLVIVGSQNWTRNTKHEAGVILCIAPVAEFYKNYILQQINDSRKPKGS